MRSGSLQIGSPIESIVATGGGSGRTTVHLGSHRAQEADVRSGIRAGSALI